MINYDDDTRNNRSLRKQHAYVVRVSLRFVALTFLSSSLLAVAIGQIAFVFIDRGVREQIWHDRRGRSADPGTDELPTLLVALHDGNHAPNTEDTATVVDTVRSDIRSRWIVTEAGQDRCWTSSLGGQQGSCWAYITAPTSDNESEGIERLPQGQHLLMDIQRVDSQFLNSEQRLTKAMFDLVDECGLTLLSYHCHSLAPSGVSCAGILLESHVSLYTWPAEGVISLDLFTCGDESLLPMVSFAEKLFSIPPPNSHVNHRIVWAHKIRGFFDDVLSGESEMTDFFNFPIGMMTDFKQEVVSEETALQRVDIYDVLLPRSQNLQDYEESLGTNDSYQATHPEFFKPDRIVFLDGVMQSRGSGDAAYHEALVHPAMFAHPNPKRVAIIGGGEGATLREVLKHKTVEKVVMIDIDQGVVDLSRKYLPGWSDCSMLEGSASNCFDDPRTELFCEDAFQWLIERYGGDEMLEEPFDVIIMDALDPQIQIPFVDALYDGGSFLQSVPKALSSDGVFLCQVGQAPGINDAAEEDSMNRNRAKFFKALTRLGFQGTRDYEEAHGGFFAPWLFFASFKSAVTEQGWLHTEGTVNYKIRSRTFSTINNTSPLLYFDGATMQSYKFPSRASEVVYCRGSMRSQICDLIEKGDWQRTGTTDICRLLSQEGYNSLFLVPTLQSTMDPGCDSATEYYRGFDPASQRRMLQATI